MRPGGGVFSTERASFGKTVDLEKREKQPYRGGGLVFPLFCWKESWMLAFLVVCGLSSWLSLRRDGVVAIDGRLTPGPDQTFERPRRTKV